ncbi:hypothetical protein F4810DRAFT_528203 [Camillea tinctor]|nr:hypothetical protein F4810DRAFT_528203 [Camillea tinctor]
MPSVKNPNGPSKNKLAARAAKARQRAQKQSSAGKSAHKSRVEKADTSRGAREGLLPTSGPNRAVSGKRRRKLERKLGYALKRKAAAEGEVEMKDVDETAAKKQKKTQDNVAKMEAREEIDMVDAIN